MILTAEIPLIEAIRGSKIRDNSGQTSSRFAGRLQNLMIGIVIFLGGFVIFEPAPYELVLIITLVVWFILGLRIPRAIFPLLILFSIFNTGGIISSFQMVDHKSGFTYVAVSFFLALTSVFFAIIISNDAKRLPLIFNVYVASAVISTMLGLLGYFHISGFGMFTKFERAAGAFQDPNVFGPFLTAPILYLVYRLLNASIKSVIPITALLGILALGLFLAFSRAAWGLTAFSLLLFYALLFINEQRARVRLKYIVLAVCGTVALILAFVAILQIDEVSKLFLQRAKVVQDYDGGTMGRFERHALGFKLALENPLGIGPLVFAKYFIEDTHNIFLKSLMAYGWLGFVCWLTMMFWTLIAGFKLLFRPRPWQIYHQIAYTIFVGHCFVGIVIDTDHWRHFYLMIGIIWGCILLEKQWQAKRRTKIPHSQFRNARPAQSSSERG